MGLSLKQGDCFSNLNACPTPLTSALLLALAQWVWTVVFMSAFEAVQLCKAGTEPQGGDPAAPWARNWPQRTWGSKHPALWPHTPKPTSSVKNMELYSSSSTGKLTQSFVQTWAFSGLTSCDLVASNFLSYTSSLKFCWIMIFFKALTVINKQQINFLSGCTLRHRCTTLPSTVRRRKTANKISWEKASGVTILLRLG